MAHLLKAGKIPFQPPHSTLQCETAYWLAGDLSKGTPIICLHGGPGVPGRYLQDIARLSETHDTPVIFYDQIGCGESTHLPETKGDESFWTFDLFEAELRNLISHLNIQGYDLFGHSWGGMLATYHTLTQTSGLRKLVLCGTPPSIGLRAAVTIRQRAAMPPATAQIFEKAEKEESFDSVEYKQATLDFYRRHMCRLDPLPQYFLDSVQLAEQDDTVSKTMYGNSIVNLSGPAKDWDVIAQLPAITEKTVAGGVLLLNGKYDTAPDEVQAPFFNHIRARVKWVRFAESSHMPMLEETETFLTVLGDFLQMA